MTMEIKREARGPKSEKRDLRTEAETGTVHFVMAEGPGAKECGQPREAERAKKTGSPLELPERKQSCLHVWISVP